MTIKNTQNPWLTLEETARYLKVSHSSLYQLAQKKLLPASKIGRTWRFHQELIDEWIQNSDKAVSHELKLIKLLLKQFIDKYLIYKLDFYIVLVEHGLPALLIIDRDLSKKKSQSSGQILEDLYGFMTDSPCFVPLPPLTDTEFLIFQSQFPDLVMESVILSPDNSLLSNRGDLW